MGVKFVLNVNFKKTSKIFTTKIQNVKFVIAKEA